MKKIIPFVAILAVAAGAAFYFLKKPSKPKDPTEAQRAILADPKAQEMSQVGALLQLAAKHDEGARKKAIEFLSKDKEALRVPAIRALSFFEDQEASEQLYKELAKTPTGPVRQFILRAYGFRANATRALQLEAYLKNPPKDLSPFEKTLANIALYSTAVEPAMKKSALDTLFALQEHESDPMAQRELQSILPKIAIGDPRLARMKFEKQNGAQKTTQAPALQAHPGTMPHAAPAKVAQTPVPSKSNAPKKPVHKAPAKAPAKQPAPKAATGQ